MNITTNNHTKIKEFMSKYLKPHSIKYRLLLMFCLVSIVPMIIVNIVSYLNISEIVESNIADYASTNLIQTNQSVHTMVSSYEDLLYQLYTDDSIIELIYKINEEKDLAVSKNQLRRKLRGVSYVKPHITSITIILDSGQMVFYDKLTASILKTSWMDNYRIPKEELYEKISSTNATQILTTEYASEYNSHKYYLFHMGHRIIDYRDIKKDIGVVILSIDERMLKEVINQSSQQNGDSASSINFIIDKNGLLLSFIDDQFLGKAVTTIDDQLNQESVISFLRENNILSGEYLNINSFYNEESKWHIINVFNQSILKEELSNQLKNTIIFILISFVILFFIVILSTNHFTKSINKLVNVMKSVENGELDAKVNINNKMPMEIALIANNFNQMIGQIKALINKVKEVSNKKKDAEIRALEAQINPHFLYNTLDTINWMAIDEEQYQISNAINSLAQILRYGIDMSNKTVKLRDELEWIKKYIFLQQIRLKSSFDFDIEAQKETLDLNIHKLLFQPFIENALVHGYQEENEEKFCLNVKIIIENGMLKITIKDNGKGINSKDMEEINKIILGKGENTNHIGIMNAIERVQLYYGDEAKVNIMSGLHVGTTIYIYLPIK